ncbi:MAG TPA: GDP-mannose 4,6-dehydratase [Acidimicrobiales bacterium]|nr:GDP-mannose 4,6-dehydratase [Acidimicrobiales bacterium]
MTAPDADFWRHRAVAVTGATGFLGSELTRQLVDLGANVVVVVRDDIPATGATTWLDQVSVVRGDVRDQELLERVLGEYEVTTAMHLAAQTQVGVANKNAVSTYDTNVRGTWSLLEAVRRSPQVSAVVVASTDKAYGEQPRLPYDEDMPLLAKHPYDVSKAAADLITQSYHHTFGVPACITRCGNFFGPGDMNWNRIVPGVIRWLLEATRPIIRSDGTWTRDYIYVVDGALAYLRTAEALTADPSLAGMAFNFSTETPLSVLELVDMLREAVGSDLEPDVQGTATNEIPHQYLSAERARRVLGWKPRYTMQEALAETVAWYRDFLAKS